LNNDVVYAEVSVGYAAIEECEDAIAVAGLSMTRIPHAALFLAGKTYQRYRASGGKRTGVLPDFFIGAHATTIGAPLLTRDMRRYRTYFPRLALISPDA
jgi:predicted nucleic acid-binding protein